MVEFRMPSLGADMDEGTVLEWLVAPGDVVHKGDVVAVVDTSKAAVEVECFDSGTIERLIVPVGETVPVGTPLAVIGDGRLRAGPAPEPVAEPAPVPELPRPPKVLASPPVRTYAKQAGVDLASVHGTGRGGAITRADVARALPPPHGEPEPPPAVKVSPYARRLARERHVDPATLPGPVVHARDVPATARGPVPEQPERDRGGGMREAIASLMSRSTKEIPHYYLSTTIDLHTALEWLREHNRGVSVHRRVVPAALLLKATAVAAAEVPALNGHWIEGCFHPSGTVRLGVAVSLRGGGLLVPSLEDPGASALDELMRTLTGVVTRARSGRLRSSELEPATLTVTNLGDLGVESVQGVIYPPQVALVGFGAISKRPWAVGDLLGVRPLVTATLAADHRANDGATGARFLGTLDRLLQRPEELR
ncbi:dihydrolipoamide acetyltransferase family protein [Prauserella flavalba]|uniref:Dihydrolipoamide acetyltransferase component of pyruvate dehydrogenase complex n=1 Tax=Prauserella flavalba TaxID=1477506 RepID=A0A318LPM2_9PSEU|nr:dihydrolipoamide acetyltransferase family protein [Prauserella flavalba]PXY36506.1 dehydrogenase [Prauserella flavalba]